MEIDFQDLGTAESPNGASVDIPVHGTAFPGAYIFVDIAFFASLPASLQVTVVGTTLKSMGLWSREPDIAIQRFGGVLPSALTPFLGPIHVTVDTPASRFVCIAYSVNADFQRNVVTYVEAAKTSSGTDNPVKFNPLWFTPSGTNTVVTTLALSHYTAGVWTSMTNIIDVIDQLYAGHSEQGGNYPIEMHNAGPTDGNAVWLMVVSAFAIHEGPLVEPVRVRGQDNAWHEVTSPANPAKVYGTDDQWHDLSATDARVRGGAQDWYSLNRSG